MAYTPIIKKLNENGTTFYTFGSAARDLSKCLGNSTTKEFVFSHFVCIKLPEIVNEKIVNEKLDASRISQRDDPDRNMFNLTAVPQNSHPTMTDGMESSVFLENGIQDYVYNFEEYVLQNSPYLSNDRGYAERIFWKWLAKTGAIAWREADETTEATAPNLFVEGAASKTNYENIVKYIGNIDVTNNVDYLNEAYTEVYIHIPAESGNTPVVLFGSEFDNFYAKNSTHEIASNFILGQDSENPLFPNVSKMSYAAMYDTPNKEYKVVEQTDGMYVDFNAYDYKDIAISPNIGSIQEYNNSQLSDSFEFNAVLVYYDIVDVSSGNKTPNLYGVMFLDNVTIGNASTYDHIQCFPKYKPVENVNNGNSYGFKLNLKIDIEPNKQGITTLVNEYNTSSMILFADALAKIQNCATTFNRLTAMASGLEERISNLENLVASMANYTELKTKVNELETELENANLAFSDRNTLLDLIAANTRDIQGLANGSISQTLQMNLDVLKPGYGISVDTSLPNNAVFNLKTSGYNICRLLNENNNEEISAANGLDFSQQFPNCNTYMYLLESANMVRVYTKNNGTLAQYDIVVKINDTLTTWKNGQCVRLAFPTLTVEELNGKNIVVLTDAGNRGGLGQYGVKVVVGNEHIKNDFPILEVVCLDHTFSNGQKSLACDIIR